MKICIFGDSVTYAGYIKEGWVNLLRWHLEDSLDEDVEVFNLGINGETSVEILKRFETEASSREPDKIVFAFGINDSCYIIDTNKPLIDKNIFKDNVIKLLTSAKSYTSEIIFIGLVLGNDSLLKPFPESSTGKSYDHRKSKDYDQILMDLAQKNDCKYISLYETLENSDFLDGLHPNKSGHYKIFNVIKLHFNNKMF